MADQNHFVREKFLVRYLSLAIFLTLAGLTWVGWNSYGWIRDAGKLHLRNLKTQQLHDTIIYFDEVLTMSARMAAVTGDLAWELRYRSFEPKLDEVIKEAMRTLPGKNQGPAAQTDAANLKLVAMANRAFDLVRQGRLRAARTILFGRDYANQKAIYAQSMNDFTEVLRKHIESNIRFQKEQAFFHLVMVLIIVPVLLVGWGMFFFAARWQHKQEMLDATRRAKRQSKRLQLRQYLSLGLIVYVGLVLTLTLSFFVLKWERRYLAEEFNHLAGDRFEAIEKGMEAHENFLTNLRRFYAASHRVEEREFQAFIATAFAESAGLKMLMWVPFVAGPERLSFEQTSSEFGVSDFQIKERNGEGNLVPARESENYFPVFYAAGPEVPSNIRGLDLGTFAAYSELFEKSRDSNKPFALIDRLFAESNLDEWNLVILLPIYESNMPVSTVEERRQHLKGYVLEVVHIEAMVEEALKTLNPAGLHIGLYDADEIQDAKLLYMHVSRRSTAARDDNLNLANRLVLESDFYKDEKRWKLKALPAEVLLSERPLWGHKVIFFVGIFITGLSVLYVYAIFQRTLEVSRLVEKRTAELSSEVTERKSAEKKLKENEEWLATTLQSIGDAVISTDPFGKVNFMNPIAENLTGWRYQDAQGRPLKEVFHIVNEQTRREVESPVEKVLREGVVIGLANHTVLIAKDGREIPLNDSGAPIRNKEGKIIGVVMVFQDVTEKRSAEQKLREREELYRLIIETANDAFISIDGQGQIREWNRRAEVILGWPRAEALGRLLEETIIPVKFRSAHHRGFQHFLATGEGPVLNKRLELSAIHRDGHEFPIELTIWAVKGEDGKYSFNAFIHDISERRKLQGQLIQAEKLVAIGTLAAGIAHEINNPVGFIGNNLSVFSKYVASLLSLLDEAKKLQNAALEKNMEKVSQAARAMSVAEDAADLPYIRKDVGSLLSESQEGVERIKKIVNDLKTFARSDSETVQNEDLHKIIESVINIVWNEMKYKAELKKDYGKLPLILCDSQQIGQVIVNLLINAIHAIPEKGIIAVHTYVKSSWACIEIKDNGAGIPQEIMGKIFDPFFTTKEVGKGTGLGLSISQEIIQRHGGKIEVQSEPGKGTTFTLYLPLVKKPA